MAEEKTTNHEEDPSSKPGNSKKEPGTFYSKIDGPVKLINGLAIVIGIFITITQYMSNSRHQREEAAKDYQKTFFQQQMTIYAEAVNESSILATTDTTTVDYRTARSKFLQLFWGRMSMFEDQCMEQKMIEFRSLMIKFENSDYSPVKFTDPCSLTSCNYDTVTQVTLKYASLRLANQSRIHTINTWLPVKEQANYNMEATQCGGK